MPSKAAKSQAGETPDISEHSRQLLKAQEEERRRISRELHDETGQALMVLRFHLEMLAADNGSAQHKGKIEESLELLDRTIEGLRRTIARLSPRVLEELGLVAAIRRQVELVTRHLEIEAALDVPEDLRRLDHDLEVAIYRSIQEALHNIAKHSRAESFSVRMRTSDSRLSVQIADDGVGFSPRAAHLRGFGLTGMRERATALGGSMKVRSKPDKGTRIQISFPLNGRKHHRAATGSLERTAAA